MIGRKDCGPPQVARGKYVESFLRKVQYMRLGLVDSSGEVVPTHELVKSGEIANGSNSASSQVLVDVMEHVL